MKITGQQTSALQDLKGGQRKDGTELARQGRGDQSQNDVVKAGSFAMDKMKVRIEAEPEVRADKVAELKERIRNGEYQVDSKKLALNLLKEGLQEGSS